MMLKKTISILLVLFAGCNQPTESQQIYGCTISSACNFNADANISNDSCINALDCNGECGTAEIDECGICGGSATTIDDCSVCDEGLALGCDGNCSTIPIILDVCNVCGGDGLSCPKIMLSVSTSSIYVGQNATLEIYLSNIQNLYALSFEMLFDSSIVGIDVESGVINYDQFTGNNFGPVVYLEDGLLSFVLGGKNIDGGIYSVNLKGLQTGYTNINLDRVNLIQEDGMDVFNYGSILLQDVIITVVSN